MPPVSQMLGNMNGATGKFKFMLQISSHTSGFITSRPKEMSDQSHKINDLVIEATSCYKKQQQDSHIYEKAILPSKNDTKNVPDSLCNFNNLDQNVRKPYKKTESTLFTLTTGTSIKPRPHKITQTRLLLREISPSITTGITVKAQKGFVYVFESPDLISKPKVVHRPQA